LNSSAASHPGAGQHHGRPPQGPRPQHDQRGHDQRERHGLSAQTALDPHGMRQAGQREAQTTDKRLVLLVAQVRIGRRPSDRDRGTTLAELYSIP